MTLMRGNDLAARIAPAFCCGFTPRNIRFHLQILPLLLARHRLPGNRANRSRGSRPGWRKRFIAPVIAPLALGVTAYYKVRRLPPRWWSGSAALIFARRTRAVFLRSDPPETTDDWRAAAELNVMSTVYLNHGSAVGDATAALGRFIAITPAAND